MKSKPIYQSRASAALTLMNLRTAYRQGDLRLFSWYFDYIPGLYMADLISESCVKRVYTMNVKLSRSKEVSV